MALAFSDWVVSRLTYVISGLDALCDATILLRTTQLLSAKLHVDFVASRTGRVRNRMHTPIVS